ncbi:glycoside hydrolase family 3 N-terminal domain-containing protein, partial [Flavobacterium sp.]|uniref:glycoside hydrolase family 3 N-terminal domain-containing protein n=1 Tax=Flavobacterium sp. TaxID=239 RepID=UPI003C4A12D8
NLAPLADINNNPNNPVIGYRSFGENKKKVAQFAMEYLEGLNDAGVLGCLKHFPGHGNTNVDSHLGLPILNENLEELLANELYPFIIGIDNQVDSIMIGHLAVPALNEGKNTSATLSKNIIEGLLRKQLKYNGLVISDALNMHSVSKLYDKKGQLEWEAFNAGNDVLCFAENVPEGIQEILKNASPERIEDSYKRLMSCKEKVGLLKGNPLAKGRFNFDTTANLNLKIAQQCITTVKDTDNHKSIIEASENNQLGIISLYKDSSNHFSETVATALNTNSFAIENGSIENITILKQKIENLDCLVVALFVPKAKPFNNFEIEDSVLTLLDHLFSTKKCILYLFGNPYALQVIPNLTSAKGIIQIYQDFPEFQETAASQLVNNTKTKGSLPVSIPGL